MTLFDTKLFDLTLWQLLLIAITAIGAQIVGGLAGYGTGLLMPVVLMPLIGAEALVPVISLSAILTNLTRVAVFRESLDLRKALTISAFAVPSTLIGAYFYTWLSGRGAALVIGVVLILVVPLRRLLVQHRFQLGPGGSAAAGVVYGFLTGGSVGVGVILLSILMSMGLSGPQIIATDALTSVILGIAKSGVFIAAGALPPKLWLVAFIIGAAATPGALVAKWMSKRFAVKLQNTLIEVAIVLGGLMLLRRAWATTAT